MSVASPLLSPQLARYEMDEFSYVSDQTSMAGSSILHMSECNDENALSLPSTSVTFTPTRVKFRPRAWERKPSTPYAPRSEAQKIWKRAPLQTITASITAPEQTSQIPRDGTTREVKRLRVGEADDNNDDKENIEYIAVKWEAVGSPPRSPRRKVAGSQQSHVLPPSRHFQLDATSISSSPSFDIQAFPEAHFHSDQAGLQLLSEAEAFEMPSELESATGSDSHLEKQLPSEPSEGIRAATEQLLDEADVFLRISPDSSPSQSMPGPMSFDVSPTRSTLDGPSETMSPAELQPQSLGPQLSQLANSDHEPEREIQLGADAGESAQPIQITTSIDQDDTSYLQDFLLRSRAQKAAKLQPVLSLVDDEEPAFSVAAFVEPEPSFLLTTFELDQPTSPSPAVENEDQDDTEAKASSPCRRSSRLTRLPRPQRPSGSLPNSIALRRLNGTEFISMQREAQSMAVTTRTNTRANRGPALPVHKRLDQMKTENPAESEEAEEQVVSKKRKNVVWAEALEAFQEYTGPPLSSSPESDMGEQTSKIGEEVQHVFDDQENASSKGVKKRRKESVGSVNGTPAPKRSIEILLEDAAQTTGQSIDMKSQHRAVKRTRSGARR